MDGFGELSNTFGVFLWSFFWHKLISNNGFPLLQATKKTFNQVDKRFEEKKEMLFVRRHSDWHLFAFFLSSFGAPKIGCTKWKQDCLSGPTYKLKSFLSFQNVLPKSKLWRAKVSRWLSQPGKKEIIVVNCDRSVWPNFVGYDVVNDVFVHVPGFWTHTHTHTHTLTAVQQRQSNVAVVVGFWSGACAGACAGATPPHLQRFEQWWLKSCAKKKKTR